MKKEILNQEENQRVKEIYLNSEDSKIEVELEPVARDSDEIMNEFKKTLKDGQFFNEMTYKDYDQNDYSRYCDSEGELYEINFTHEEFNTYDTYVFNFDLDENQKRLMIEYLKATSNGVSTEIICDMNDHETDGECVCENGIMINNLTFKYSDYYGEIALVDSSCIFDYEYNVVRRMVDDEEDDEK